jgi:uncharacterized protein
MRLGSLFFGLFTLGEIFHSRIASAGKGTKSSSFRASLLLSIFACGFVAAEQNEPLAQANLGVMYANGLGVTKDYEKALEWFYKAADQNDPGAENNLGWMCENGFGVTRDYVKAVQWYRKAAAGGLAKAENNIGIFYLKGLGIPRDRREAIQWFRHAAVHGDPDALRNLKSLGIKR